MNCNVVVALSRCPRARQGEPRARCEASSHDDEKEETGHEYVTDGSLSKIL